MDLAIGTCLGVSVVCFALWCARQIVFWIGER
jgi:hypothetical protein